MKIKRFNEIFDFHDSDVSDLTSSLDKKRNHNPDMVKSFIDLYDKGEIGSTDWYDFFNILDIPWSDFLVKSIREKVKKIRPDIFD